MSIGCTHYPVLLPVMQAMIRLHVQCSTDGRCLDRLKVFLAWRCASSTISVQWSPGGKGAHTILERFVQNGLRTFNAHRAKTDRESTSSLSPHVHFGEISTRHIFYMVGTQSCQVVVTDQAAGTR